MLDLNYTPLMAQQIDGRVINKYDEKGHLVMSKDPKATVIDSSTISNEEWLDYRKQLGFGGSDSAAIMTGKFQSAKDIYFAKIGMEKHSEEENWLQLALGHANEDIILRLAKKELGMDIRVEHHMWRHPIYPFMFADIDGLIFITRPDGKKEMVIAECKTTSYEKRFDWGTNKNPKIPSNYVWQATHYMSVWNVERVHFFVLFDNNKNGFVHRIVKRDLNRESMLIQTLIYMDECVRLGIEPDDPSADSTIRSINMWVQRDPEKKVELKPSKQVNAALNEFLRIDQEQKKAEKLSRDLNKQKADSIAVLMSAMGDANTADLGIYRITYNSSRPKVFTSQLWGENQQLVYELLSAGLADISISSAQIAAIKKTGYYKKMVDAGYLVPEKKGGGSLSVKQIRIS